MSLYKGIQKHNSLGIVLLKSKFLTLLHVKIYLKVFGMKNVMRILMLGELLKTFILYLRMGFHGASANR